MPTNRIVNHVSQESIDAAHQAQVRERAASGLDLESDGRLRRAVTPCEATDGLYDCSPAHLAAVFGRRAMEMILCGRNPYEAARLAGHFAEQAIHTEAN